MTQTVVTAEIPYPLIWDKAGWLPLRLEGKSYEIGFERSWRLGNSRVEMKFDRQGRVSYTRVAVRLPYLTTGDDSEELIRLTHKAVNRLLDVYRVSTKEFHVGPIPAQELGPVNLSHGIVDLKGDGSARELLSFRFDMGSGLTLARTQEMDSESILDLAYERPLPVVDLLVLNARRSLLYEDYRIAVIEAETAFEVGVDQVLKRYCLSQTKMDAAGNVVAAYSNDDVERLLDAGLTNLIQDHLPKALGRDFINTDEHQRWHQDLYLLRNAVIHDGEKIQADQADRALAASEDALVYMGVITPERWPADDRLNRVGGQ